MKKIFCMMLAAMFLAPMVVLAEGPGDDEGMMPPMMEDEGMPPMMGEEGMGKQPSMMGGLGKMGCCPMMSKPKMEVTEEGAVIILSGNKLIKYDSDLNLVKQVEIPMPAMDAKQCPMMGRKPADASPTEAGAAPAAEAKPAEAALPQTV